MKIKKVEIDSFRLFNDETVPFVNPQRRDGCANLVAIHAPNGFGKTSLFDAIEFCMTKNIKRLKDTVFFADDVRSDKAQNDFSSFIHNKDNPDKEIGIRIEYEDGTTKETKVAPANELKLLKGNPENEFFSEVMLSQDWFSRFLSATDATQRFEMFTKNFKDTDGLLDYYEQLKSAHNIIKKRISSINSDLLQEKKKLKDDVDEQIIEHLNEAIKQLVKTGVSIEWNRAINEKQLEYLTLQGEQGLFEAEERRRIALEVVGNIEQLKSGHDELIALSDITAVLAKIDELAKSIKEAQEQSHKIQTLKTLIDSVELLSKEVVRYEVENKELDYLIRNYPAYKEIANQIDGISKQCEVKVKERELQNGLILAKNKELNAIREQLVNLTKEREGWKNRKESLKDEYAIYAGLLSQIKLAKEEEQKEVQKLSQLTPNLEEHDNELKRLELVLITARQGQLSVEMDGYVEESREIILLAKSLKEKAELADNLGSAIKEQYRYMGQVEALVVSAREMAVTLKSGVCPLCGKNYGQVEDLLKAIEGNSSISKSIEGTIRLKEETEQEIVSLKNKSRALYQRLEEKVTERINAIKKDIKDLLVKKKEIDNALVDIRQKRQRAQEMIKADYSAFENLTEAQVQAIYEERLQRVEKQLDDVTKLKETKAGDLVKMQAIFNELTHQIDGLNLKLLEKKRLPEYTEYQDKVKEHGDEQPLVDEWKKKLEGNDIIIAGFKEKTTSAQNEKLKMESEGVSLAEEFHLTDYLNVLNANKKTLDTKYLKTIQFIRDNCRAKMVDSDTAPDIIALEVEKSRKYYAEEVEESGERAKMLASYMNLLKSAEKYNNQQKLKKAIGDLEKQAERNGKRLEDIDKETENLKKYLEEFVQSYFQLDLINRLYNTIDPHPSYKIVDFICDFNQKKPKLYVIMGSKKDDGDKIVPNLYLSTAQINILSFCIFMAKALFAKTDNGKAIDCIFVDDPIQALDDINILSMIDLIRNVAFTLNKQIVITTHDLNFFNLLQKKMPQDKFNSCYLQLKERGKVTVIHSEN